MKTNALQIVHLRLYLGFYLFIEFIEFPIRTHSGNNSTFQPIESIGCNGT